MHACQLIHSWQAFLLYTDMEKYSNIFFGTVPKKLLAGEATVQYGAHQRYSMLSSDVLTELAKDIYRLVGKPVNTADDRIVKATLAEHVLVFESDGTYDVYFNLILVV